MADGIWITGIGMHAFGRTDGVSGLEQGVVAAKRALADADLGWEDVQMAFGGSSAAGNADTMVSTLGLTGLPFLNVANGCATGGSALVSAVNAIRAGECDTAMAIGFDKHPRGAFDPKPEAWGLPQWYGSTGLMLTTQFFALKVQRYLAETGIDPGVLATIAAKAFRYGAANEMAWRRKPFSEEEIAAAPMVSDPLTQYMFCSPGEGAVAVVLSSKRQTRSVKLASAVVRSRRAGSFEVFAPWLAPGPLVGRPGPTRDAAAAAFAAADVGPSDVEVAQVQDTEAGAELMHLAEVGLCADGEQERFLADGRVPVNTDGGCIANGEPIGASGLRQVHEVVLQLRGDAGERQVGNPRLGFTHVYGAPGISACTVLQR